MNAKLLRWRRGAEPNGTNDTRQELLQELVIVLCVATVVSLEFIDGDDCGYEER